MKITKKFSTLMLIFLIMFNISIGSVEAEGIWEGIYSRPGTSAIDIDLDKYMYSWSFSESYGGMGIHIGFISSKTGINTRYENIEGNVLYQYVPAGSFFTSGNGMYQISVDKWVGYGGQLKDWTGTFVFYRKLKNTLPSLMVGQPTENGTLQSTQTLIREAA